MRRDCPYNFGIDIEKTAAEVTYDAQRDCYFGDGTPVIAAFQKGRLGANDIKIRKEFSHEPKILW